MSSAEATVHIKSSTPCKVPKAMLGTGGVSECELWLGALLGPHGLFCSTSSSGHEVKSLQCAVGCFQRIVYLSHKHM